MKTIFLPYVSSSLLKPFLDDFPVDELDATFFDHMKERLCYDITLLKPYHHYRKQPIISSRPELEELSSLLQSFFGDKQTIVDHAKKLIAEIQILKEQNLLLENQLQEKITKPPQNNSETNSTSSQIEKDNQVLSLVPEKEDQIASSQVEKDSLTLTSRTETSEVLPSTIQSVFPIASPPPIQKSVYRGDSIVDYLKSVRRDSSYAARKVYAEQMGIHGYSGTAAQNTEMLRRMRGW